MIQVIPNSGIFNDENLDRLRGEAIMASQGGLPEPLVYYLRALESRLLDFKAEAKQRAIREIAWKFKPLDEAK